MKKILLAVIALASFPFMFAEKPACISSYPLDSADFAHLKGIDMPLVIVETVDSEEPTYDIVYPPQGALGVSITNATKVPGRVVMTLHDDTLYDSKNYVKGESGMTIKIRGNGSAAGTAKPGYKIKLQKKDDLLRRGDKKYKDKNWNLILDWNLKIMECFWVNELLGLQWTPQFEFVNLVINNEYRGWFALLESVERNTNCRLDVAEEGYIFELDAYWWNEPMYIPSGHLTQVHYTLKYPDPEDITPEQQEYITNEITQMETHIWTADSAHKSIDIQSFASWMLAQDILGNVDGSGSNMFYTKYDTTPHSKIQAGNLWDFEGVEVNTTSFATVHHINLFEPLFKYQPEFVQAYLDKWNEVEPYLFDSLNHRIDAYAQSVSAQAMDSSRLLRKWVYDWSDTCTVDVDLTRMKKWLSDRRVWLNNTIQATYSKPNHLKSISTGAVPMSNQGRYYTLMGEATTTQHKGLLIYIDEKGLPHKLYVP